MEAALDNLIRTGDRKKFYASPAWRRVRKLALARDKDACVRCKAHGRYSAANTVHHIQALKVSPHLALTLSNLQSLCHKCHEEIEGRNIAQAKSKWRQFPERW